MTQATPRSISRSVFDMPTRMSLVENDLDGVDVEREKIVEELASTRDKLGDEIAGLKRVLVGILVTLTTGSLGLAIDIIVRTRR